MTKPITIILAAAIAALVGCASQRPVLYPNAHLNQVGTTVAERDIDLCMRMAEDYVASGGRTGKALEGAAVGGGTGAAVGAAAGAAVPPGRGRRHGAGPVRPGRAGRHQPFDVLEHAGQRGGLRGGVAAGPPERA